MEITKVKNGGSMEFKLTGRLDTCLLYTSQFDEFYKAFGVTESDGMYLAPEDRLIIW